MAKGSEFRTYGCRITEYIMNGMRCVSIENSQIRVSILADKGTDIFEFRFKPMDIDYLWRSHLGLRSPYSSIPSVNSSSGNYLDYYEGGWQELFPNIGDDCMYKNAHLGIHGEVCLLPWNYKIMEDCENEVKVKFWVRTVRTPFYIEKTMSIRQDQPILHIEESIINEGAVEMDYMWGHHPAFGYPFLDGEMFVDIPAAKGRTFHSELHPIFPVNRDFTWPLLESDDGKKYDLSTLPVVDTEWAGICHAYDLEDGWCAITNPRKGLGFGMVWDKQLFPNVWIWMVYGGLKNYPWYGRAYTVALEQCARQP